MGMIADNYEVIVQDQLIKSAVPGKVRARYPRGTDTQLQVGADGAMHIQTNPDADGAFEQATVLPNGNLLYCSDTPTSVPTIVLGANLKPL